MGPARRRTTRAAVVRVVVAALTLPLTGCATEAVRTVPRGVDGLQVPTPTPDPRDFVDGLDNPWIGFDTGQPQLYRAGDLTRTVTLGDSVTVADVTTTAVRVEETDADGRPTDVHDDLLAQDRAGNVWLFGRRVLEGDARSWQAGEDGAEAGLLLPARPRRGDGYAVADARGADEDRAQVVAYDGDVLTVVVSSDLDPGSQTIRTYDRGVGLVEEQDGATTWQLDPGAG